MVVTRGVSRVDGCVVAWSGQYGGHQEWTRSGGGLTMVSACKGDGSAGCRRV